MEFNALHPTHIIRERGWKPEPNPFLPRPPRPAHQYFDKRIFIYANQLFYDFDTATRIIGKARRNANDAQGEGIQTSENDQERPMVYRWFNKYLQKVESNLSAYIMKPEGRVRDNSLKEWEEKEIWLRMPDYWDDSRYDSLVEAIHNYIVTGALLEYFKYTLTSKDPITIDKATELTDIEPELIDCANATKSGAMVHTLKPFG